MKFVFSRLNTIILIIAIIITIAAYVIMGTGDKTISPILLVITYVVLFPLAIIIGSNKKDKNLPPSE
jgi:hypothetical protein